MFFGFNSHGVCEKPILSIANPNFVEVGAIRDAKNLKFSPKLVSTSSLSFTADSTHPSYDKIEKGQLIHLINDGGIGWFVITDSPETNDGIINNKEVICESYEYVLGRKSADIPSGTYKLYGEGDGSSGILNIILNACPRWRVGYVSPSLSDKYRTFDMPDDSVYGFLTEEAAKAFGCIFVFDYENLSINAYTAEDLVKKSRITLRYSNLLKNAKISPSADDIVTAVAVYGSNEFSITDINPLGTAYIYKYDYYKDKMSPMLWKKVSEWQDRLQNAYNDDLTDETSIAYWRDKIHQQELTKLSINSDIEKIKVWQNVTQNRFSIYNKYEPTDTEKSLLVEIKNVVTHGGTYAYKILEVDPINNYSLPINITYLNENPVDTDDYTRQYQSIKVHVDALCDAIRNSASDADLEAGILYAEGLINKYICDRCSYLLGIKLDHANQSITLHETKISEIHSRFSFENNFTQQELVELNDYTIASKYENEYIIMPETIDGKPSSYKDKLTLETELYQEAYDKLEIISTPSYSVELSLLSFVFDKDNEPYVEELNQFGLGMEIYAEVKENVWMSLVLTEMEIDYDSPDTLSMVFSSNTQSSTNQSILEELLQKTSKVQSMVSSTFHSLIKPTRDGILDTITSLISQVEDQEKRIRYLENLLNARQYF